MPTIIPAHYAWSATPKAGDQINSTALSGDGSRLILGTSNEYQEGYFAVYCYDQSGQLCWYQPISQSTEPSYQGVFWVAISRDGNYAAAGGERAKSGEGFLYAYDARSGENLLSLSTDSRVNQVSLTNDGRYLVAAYANKVALFERLGDRYEAKDTYAVEDQAYVNSAMVSNQGNRAVVSVIQYEDGTTDRSGSVGGVIALNIEDGQFSLHNKTLLDAGSIRVAIIDSGQWWGAALHDGSCAVFNDYSSQLPVWRYTPEEHTSIAYAFSITATSVNKLYVAYGANIEDSSAKGCVYALESVIEQGVSKPSLIWKQKTTFGVNPGVNMDLEAQYVTATDGSPSGGGETAGNFYLFDHSSGEQLWDVPTSMMNWPMSISADGNAIFGASDNGTAYYWHTA